MARRLLVLSGIAIFCVVVFHAAGWGIVAMYMWAHRYLPVESPSFEQAGLFWDVFFRLIEQLAVFCIPAFLFVSGCFVAITSGREPSKLNWTRPLARARSLLIPYLIWVFIILLGQVFQGRQLHLGQLAPALLTGDVNPAYYYVPLIIQLYLLSPVLYRLAKKAPVGLLVVSGMIVILRSLLNAGILLGMEAPILATLSGLLPKWFFPVRLFWFALGIVFVLNVDQIYPIIKRLRWWLLLSIVVLFVAGNVEWEWMLRISGRPWAQHLETIIDAVYSLVVIFGLLAFSDNQFPLEARFMDLGARSYGIYLIHPLIMEYFSRGVYHLAPDLLSSQVFLQSSLIVLGLAIPLAMMFVVRNSRAQSVYSTLFG